MKTVTLTLDLPEALWAKVQDIATRERRTPEAQVLVLLEQITTFDEAFKRHAAAVSDELTIAELVPLMPPGLRSRSSVNRLLAAGAITGRKVLGTWTFDLAKVRADLDHFERISSVASLRTIHPRKNPRKSPRPA